MSGHLILITGASGLLGRQFTKHFLEKGETVVAVCRSNKSKAALQAFCGDYYEKLLHFVLVDLTDPIAVKLIIEVLEAHNLEPDILINGARDVDDLTLQEDGSISRDNFIRQYLLDVVVPYELSVALVSHSSNIKHIINVSSQYGSVATNPLLYEDQNQPPVNYGVSKAALNHLTRELACRLAPKGIQVNCIAYGGVEGRVNSTFTERYSMLCPTQRMLYPEEVSFPVDMLVSEKNTFMTGVVLAVDGGWTLW